MSQPERLPYEHTLAEINEINAACNSITSGRGVPGDMAVGILTTRSNLAIAAALLAVADAIRSTQPEHCVHSRAMHDRHHQQPVDNCPWCTGGTTHHKPGDLL